MLRLMTALYVREVPPLWPLYPEDIQDFEEFLRCAVADKKSSTFCRRRNDDELVSSTAGDREPSDASGRQSHADVSLAEGTSAPVAASWFGRAITKLTPSPWRP
jgi:hypothetical protein